MKHGKRYLLAAAVLCLALLPLGKARAAERLFDIVVKDGYSTQTIEMKYGKTPYGYTSYYANQSLIYVHPKSKKVTFSVKRNTSSRYGNFHFAQTEMKPGDQPVGNLFNYTVDGRMRAWMFTVRKYVKPEITGLKVSYSPRVGTLTQKKKSYARIKATVKAEVPVKTVICILNEKGRAVYKKTDSADATKTYLLKWDGRASKGNSAKLKAGAKVPAGEYAVRITVHPQTGGKVKEVVRQEKLKVGQ